MSSVVSIPLSQLRIADTPRASGVDEGHLSALVEAGDAVPPILVQRSTMQVIDGVHRVRAAQRRSLEAISAVLFDGDERQAYVMAVQMNSAHGLPLSLADRKVAATRILSYFPDWSNRRLALVVGLSDKTMASLASVRVPKPRRLPGGG